MNRKERMIDYLKKYRLITTRQAVLDLGNCSPTKTISELRREGYKIIDVTVKGKNRFGEKCHWKRYTLIEQ